VEHVTILRDVATVRPPTAELLFVSKVEKHETTIWSENDD
jgi:hypothetical protein